MTIHKRARLTPVQRQEISDKYYRQNCRIYDLCRQYNVSRPTIYHVLERGRQKDFSIHKSINKRFRCLKYGLKRLSKIEKQVEDKLRRQTKRYNKKYPGEMMHSDTTELPLLKGASRFKKPEHLYVAIDDFPGSFTPPFCLIKLKLRPLNFWNRLLTNVLTPLRYGILTTTASIKAILKPTLL